MTAEVPLATGPTVVDPAVGHRLPPLVVRPTEVQLFRFSAATSNPHRIHYDLPYARAEGYPGVLVQSHLHAVFLSRTVTEWAGPRATLLRFRWENRHLAMPGDVLTCTGEVTSVDHRDGVLVVECSLEERNQDGVLCAPAWATVQLPLEAA